MDVNTMHGPMDFNLDNMEAKHGKMLPSLDDRLDSGVDSIKDDDMVKDFEEMTLNSGEERTEEYEPWREPVTEDGDTLLHLAIIHEATEHAFQMIQLSRNHSFLNKQNHQRQVTINIIAKMPVISNLCVPHPKSHTSSK
ncbi:hypothetical protein ILYODFUR_008404 [Ilyodon furcidens]|uniref:Uncharacterized protein n=1 Tax=Ilyodon furcidens TaxID=33524 RepID=A0ABV0TVQ2_9TELE